MKKTTEMLTISFFITCSSFLFVLLIKLPLFKYLSAKKDISICIYFAQK
ncbi:hypothetical protein J651_2179 [Acinetobacter baumannii 1293320]|nr:hypothetical protein J651_2179 [Acinetobacter baumannii 1293320]